MRKPERVKTVLAIFESSADAGRTVAEITRRAITPVAIEMLDGVMLRMAEEATHAGYPMDAEAVLLIELEGLDEAVEEQVEQLRESCALCRAREFRIARSEEERELLWKGLQDGTIDCIVSDHSPSTLDLKDLENGDFAVAWGGVSSLQLGLSLIWTEARHRGIPLTLEAIVKYVILLLNTEAVQSMSEAEGQQWYAEIGAWYEKGGGGSGKLVETGYQLAPPTAAKTGRAAGVTGGPFMETKEALGGYSVLDTDTIEEAVEIAKTWPGVDKGWMTVEVRPVIEM